MTRAPLNPFLRDDGRDGLELVVPTGEAKGGGAVVIPLPFEAVLAMQQASSMFVWRHASPPAFPIREA